jgi:hypothetical protein
MRYTVSRGKDELPWSLPFVPGRRDSGKRAAVSRAFIKGIVGADESQGMQEIK